MSEFQIKEASRSGVKALIGMYGRSGSGKSMSALLLMRGLIGPKGRLVLIDSESGRGSLFADIIPGGYKVLDLEPPFSPDRYQEAFEAAEAVADGVVIDSLSHCHSGEGGLLDMQEAELDRMAGDNWSKREACKMASWIKPKIMHKKFIQRILRCKVPLICCLRGEEKTHMVKGDDGKNKVITDQFSSPIFDPRFLFELLLNFENVSKNGKGGYVIPRKITHPDIAAILPKEDQQISVAFGEALAKWCSAPQGPGTNKPASDKPVDPTAALKKKLWDLTKEQHHGEKKLLLQWLIDEALIDPAVTLEDLSESDLRAVIKKTETKLQPTTQET